MQAFVTVNYLNFSTNLEFIKKASNTLKNVKSEAKKWLARIPMTNLNPQN